MSRRARGILVIVVVLLVAAAAALVLTARPRLEADRDRVDDRWAKLRQPLATRYEALVPVLDALRDAGDADRDVARDLSTALDRWQGLAKDPDAEADAATEVEVANRLEGIAARVRATVAASARLQAVAPLVAALDAFSEAALDPTLVRRYNDAAARYQRSRQGFTRSLVADLLGYDARASLVVP